MIMVGIGIIFYTMAFALFMITYIFPIFKIVYLDWIGMGLTLIPWIFLLYRIKITRCWYHVDRLPIWKHLINYIRRDNEIIPVIGQRAYPGESFIDVEKIGLIEFLGKDCVYQWGDKKIVWGLENINYTPDPRYFNFTHLLYELGFSDTNDVINVLRGDDLELMGKIYINIMEYDNLHGAEKLMDDMANYSGETKVFEAVPETKHDKIAGILDKLPSKGD